MYKNSITTIALALSCTLVGCADVDGMDEPENDDLTEAVDRAVDTLEDDGILAKEGDARFPVGDLIRRIARDEPCKILGTLDGKIERSFSSAGLERTVYTRVQTSAGEEMATGIGDWSTGFGHRGGDFEIEFGTPDGDRGTITGDYAPMGRWRDVRFASFSGEWFPGEDPGTNFGGNIGGVWVYPQRTDGAEAGFYVGYWSDCSVAK